MFGLDASDLATMYIDEKRSVLHHVKEDEQLTRLCNPIGTDPSDCGQVED